ncbi:hypothetical protein [Tateyamaria pelophila]|uniref:hypothetical protein n=1 Tax=Tateyamaria pelophila TaxID=328415 RepID=UPI001CBE2FFC|nr:hypothetical protein [Tateyamaria pelophila]
MKRIFWLGLVTGVGIVLLYLSRFWIWSVWPRSGLFGLEDLRPQGGLLATWLRGTDFAPFELLVWAIGVFLILTILQKLYDRLS